MSNDLMPIQPQHRGKEYTTPYAVGIELEIEFDSQPPPLPSLPSLHFKQDGSLTNGMEMVFRHPFPKTKLQDPADEMIQAIETALQLTGGRVVLSPRAGTHFHVNVVGQTPLAAAKAYLLMCAIEPRLFELFPTRKENIFCLPSFMSDRQMMDLAKYFTPNQAILNWSNDMGHYRYSATNPAAIARFGSIELRMVPTMIDSKKMARWGLCFANLIQTGCEVSTKDLCNSVADMSWLNRIIHDRSPIEMPTVDTPAVHEHLDKIRWLSEKLFLHERRLHEVKRINKNLAHLGEPPQPMYTISSSMDASIFSDRTVDDLMFLLIEEGRAPERFDMNELRQLTRFIDHYMEHGPEEPEDEFMGRYTGSQIENAQNALWHEIERRELAQQRPQPRPRFPNPPRPRLNPFDPTPPEDMTVRQVEEAMRALRDNGRVSAEQALRYEANPAVTVGFAQWGDPVPTAAPVAVPVDEGWPEMDNDDIRPEPDGDDEEG